MILTCCTKSGLNHSQVAQTESAILHQTWWNSTSYLNVFKQIWFVNKLVISLHKLRPRKLGQCSVNVISSSAVHSSQPVFLRFSVITTSWPLKHQGEFTVATDRCMAWKTIRKMSKSKNSNRSTSGTRVLGAVSRSFMFKGTLFTRELGRV